jgi:RNA polymerase sigma-70 factor, ECF subfamily
VASPNPAPDPPLEDRIAMRALAVRVATGERVAAEEFARILMPTVRAVSARLVANPADAADIAQLGLVEVLRAAGNYRGEGPLVAWARRIAFRTACHWLRSAAARRGADLDAVDTVAGQEHQEGLGDGLVRPLSAYLGELGEAQRTALVLRVGLEYTLPEIAEITGSPIATVKSRIVKALSELRRAVRRDVQLGVRKDAS